MFGPLVHDSDRVSRLRSYPKDLEFLRNPFVQMPGLIPVENGMNPLLGPVRPASFASHHPVFQATSIHWSDNPGLFSEV